MEVRLERDMTSHPYLLHTNKVEVCKLEDSKTQRLTNSKVSLLSFFQMNIPVFWIDYTTLW